MLKRKWPHFLDWFLNTAFLLTCMICYRRGIWDLLYYYIYKDQEPFSYWVITGIGCLSFLAYFIYPVADGLLKKCSKWVRAVGVRLTMVVGGVFALAYWRGIWGLANYYSRPYGCGAKAVVFVISYGIPIICQTSRTIVFPPFVLGVDQRASVLEPVTMLRTKLTTKPRDVMNYTLDCLLTHFFNLTLTVLAWWSLIEMQREVPFPPKYAAMIHTFIGLGFIILMFFLEIPMAMLLRRLTKGCEDKASRGGENRDGSVVKTSNSSNGVNQFSETENLEKDQETIGNDNPTNMNAMRQLSTSSVSSESGILESIKLPEDSDNVPKVKQSARVPRAFVYTGLSKEDWIKLIFYDIVYLIAFMGEGFFWLGFWILNEYVTPDLILGGWLNHILGTFLLICLQSMSYGGACGCAFDLRFADDDDEFGLYIYHNYYVRFFIKERRNSGKETEGTVDNKEQQVKMEDATDVQTHAI